MENFNINDINVLKEYIQKILNEQRGEIKDDVIPIMEVYHYVKTPSTYHQSQKNAIKKYISNNREKYNDYHRNRHKEKMETDPEYKEQFKARMRNYYIKRKQKKALIIGENEQEPVIIGEPVDVKLDVEEIK